MGRYYAGSIGERSYGEAGRDVSRTRKRARQRYILYIDSLAAGITHRFEVCRTSTPENQ
jgi:hypothetical protein